MSMLDVAVTRSHKVSAIPPFSRLVACALIDKTSPCADLKFVSRRPLMSRSAMRSHVERASRASPPSRARYGSYKVGQPMNCIMFRHGGCQISHKRVLYCIEFFESLL